MLRESFEVSGVSAAVGACKDQSNRRRSLMLYQDVSVRELWRYTLTPETFSKISNERINIGI